MNHYVLAHQTLVTQLQILTWLARLFAFFLNANQKLDLWPKWYLAGHK
jgi:hypothetical protein